MTHLAGYIALLLITLLAFTLVAFLSRIENPEVAREKFLNENGFEAFKRDFPTAIRQGRVTCPKCSSTRMWVRRGRKYDAHCCQTCARVHYLS